MAQIPDQMVGTPFVVGVPLLTLLLVTLLARRYADTFWASRHRANTAVSGLTLGGAYGYNSQRPVERKDVDDAARGR